MYRHDQKCKFLQREVSRNANTIAALPWQPMIGESQRKHAQEAALCVAERMRDPERVQKVAQVVRNQLQHPNRWSVFTPGNAGDMALLYNYVAKCFPGFGWETYAQRYLNLVALGTQQKSLLQPGLFTGTSGIALIVNEFSEGKGRYQKTLANLHRGLREQICNRQWRSPESQGGIVESDFDLITGAAGMLGYLVRIETVDEHIQEAITVLLEYLLWLAEPGQAKGLERWFCPPALLPSDQARQVFPQGRFNCGLAHGIPGPLAALALTRLAGYRYPGLCESIAYLSNWVVQHHVMDQWGMNWSDSVPFQYASSVELWCTLSGTRTAWCYGAPGVARSLWLAGKALEDTSICKTALEGVEAVLHRPIQTRRIDSPSLCHGIAGLLQICLRFAHECESELIHEHIPLLVTQILDTFNPDHAFGFRNIESEGVLIDQPSWLTGTPGTAMALLSAATAVMPTWDRKLLLA